MRRTCCIGGLIGVLAMATPPGARAADGMRPGLWEQRIVKVEVDGNRKSQFSEALAAGQRQTREMLASAAQNDPHYSAQGNPRECISAAMAADFNPDSPAEPGCDSKTVRRDAHHLVTQKVCNSEGTRSTATIDVVLASELIRINSDTSLTLPNGEAHAIHSEMENRFVKADCGALQPDMPAPGAAAAPAR